MKVRKNLRNVLWYVVAVCIATVTVYPFLWMIATSLKPEGEIYSKSLSLLSEKVIIDTGSYWCNNEYISRLLSRLFLCEDEI